MKMKKHLSPSSSAPTLPPAPHTSHGTQRLRNHCCLNVLQLNIQDIRVYIQHCLPASSLLSFAYVSRSWCPETVRHFNTSLVATYRIDHKPNCRSPVSLALSAGQWMIHMQSLSVPTLLMLEACCSPVASLLPNGSCSHFLRCTVPWAQAPVV